jgi:DNA polymerase-1
MFATIDIETTGLNRYKDKITWIGVGLSKSVDEPIFKYKIFDGSKQDDMNRFKFFVKKLAEKKAKTVFQNGKFDTLFIEEHLDVRIPIHEDVMLMGTAYDLVEEHGLKKMAQRYLGVCDWDISKKEKLSGSAESVVPYLKCDVKYTWELFQYFKENMTTQQLKIYYKLLKPAYLTYRDIERNGAYIDVPKLRQVRKAYAKREQESLNKLKLKYDINWNSSGQIQDVLFNQEKMPILAKSEKTGKPSAGASVLKKLANQGYEIPQLILDYKEVNTLNKMFLNRWEGDLGSDGRIHPSFGLTNVRTGRTSCQNPNLQQVPRNLDVRSLFNAPPGRLFFEADYSQLELRIAAEYSGDKTMLDIYHNNGDIHTTTAKLMTGGREPTKEERGKAKAVNFGFLYGMSARKFVEYAYDSYGVVFTRSEAETFRKLFFAKYSRLLPWHHEQELLCEALGGVSNKFGRFRKLPNIYSSDKFERSGAVRRAINTPVQGTGSDLLISAVTQINREFKDYGVKIVGTVHDSILGEFREQDRDWIVPEIRRIMLHPQVLDDFEVELGVPLEVDIGVGPWGTH